MSYYVVSYQKNGIQYLKRFQTKEWFYLLDDSKLELKVIPYGYRTGFYFLLDTSNALLVRQKNSPRDIGNSYTIVQQIPDIDDDETAILWFKLNYGGL